MKPAAINRLEKLEWAHGAAGSRVQCIEYVAVDPGPKRHEPHAYRDELGNRWAREPGEKFEDFHERVTADAISFAHPKIAIIARDEDC